MHKIYKYIILQSFLLICSSTSNIKVHKV